MTERRASLLPHIQDCVGGEGGKTYISAPRIFIPLFVGCYEMLPVTKNILHLRENRVIKQAV